MERPSREIAKITPEFLNCGCFDGACSERAHIARVKHADSVVRVAQPGLIGRLRAGSPARQCQRKRNSCQDDALFLAPWLPLSCKPLYHLRGRGIPVPVPCSLLDREREAGGVCNGRDAVARLRGNLHRVRSSRGRRVRQGAVVLVAVAGIAGGCAQQGDQAEQRHERNPLKPASAARSPGETAQAQSAG